VPVRASMLCSEGCGGCSAATPHDGGSPAASSSTAGDPLVGSPSARWLQRVRQVQQRLPPNPAGVRHAQQRQACLRKCRAQKALAMRTRALVAEGLRQMSEADSPAQVRAAWERWQNAQHTSRQREQRRVASLPRYPQQQRRPSPVSRGNESRSSSSSSLRSADLLRGESSSEESALAEVARHMGALISGTMAESVERPAEEVEAVDPTEVSAQLVQLRAEPADPEVRAAKFLLYEAYSIEVGSIRQSLLEFQAESRPFLPLSTIRAMDEQAAAIDSEEAMSIPAESREWFAYHMLRVAERNNVAMARKLEDLEQQLAFSVHSEPIECPACWAHLDVVQNPFETLGCCHQVCKECWHTWSQFMRSQNKNPFCPLCHCDEFRQAVMEEHSGYRSTDAPCLSTCSVSQLCVGLSRQFWSGGVPSHMSI